MVKVKETLQHDKRKRPFRESGLFVCGEANRLTITVQILIG